MNASSFHTAVIRLGILEASELASAGVPLSKREHKLFDADPVHFFATECGPSRRAQIFALIDQSRTVPIVAVIEDREPAEKAAA